MNNSKSLYEQYKNKVFNWPIRLGERIFGKKFIICIVAIVVVLVIILFLLSLSNQGFEFKKNFTSDYPTEKLNPTLTPQPEPLATPQIETPLKDSQVLGEKENPCTGKMFDIVTELDDVQGKEKFSHIDADDPTIVSAGESMNFQATKRYPFSCKPPWIAKFSFIPRKEQSMGVFFEYEDTFKVTFGDGDRLTWVVQKNDQGTRRADWTEVSKEKLASGSASLNHEVIVEITLEKIENNLIYVRFKVGYQAEGKNVFGWIESTKAFQPKAVNLLGEPSRAFRIGINDSRFKGKGSEIKFGGFSVEEIR